MGLIMGLIMGLVMDLIMDLVMDLVMDPDNIYSTIAAERNAGSGLKRTAHV
jgi:hypothetical protein